MSHYDVRLELEFNLEVAHYMTNVPKDHFNGQMHGHSYLGLAIFQGPIDPETGMLLDYDHLKRNLSEYLTKYDHKVLNDLPGLQHPSSENLAKVLYEDLSTTYEHLKAIRIWRPTLGLNIQYPGDF
ncbi:6-carboxytetrahydropterin synthase [bacterium]|nr:6-carboxytetrahydropterin synthase [bacterium]